MIGWLDKTLAALVVLLMLAGSVLLVINANMRASLAKAEANTAQLSQTNSDFKNLVDKQNAQVSLLQQEAIARADHVRQALQRVHQQTMLLEKRAGDLEKTKPAGDDCQAAHQLWQNYRQALP